MPVPPVERLPWDAGDRGDRPPRVRLWSRRNRGPDGLVEGQLGLTPSGGEGLQALKYVAAGLGSQAPSDHRVYCHAGFFGEKGCLALHRESAGHGCEPIRCCFESATDLPNSDEIPMF